MRIAGRPERRTPSLTSNLTQVSQSSTTPIERTMATLQLSVRLRQAAIRVPQTSSRPLTNSSRRFTPAGSGTVNASLQQDSSPRPNSGEHPHGGSGQHASELIRQEDAVRATPSHQPDYNVVVDYRTSYVTTLHNSTFVCVNHHAGLILQFPSA